MRTSYNLPPFPSNETAIGINVLLAELNLRNIEPMPLINIGLGGLKQKLEEIIRISGMNLIIPSASSLELNQALQMLIDQLIEDQEEYFKKVNKEIVKAH